MCITVYMTYLLIVSEISTCNGVETYESKYGRELLQIANISCDWTESDNNTCKIYASNGGHRDIECHPDHPNCRITVVDYIFTTIYCPINNCLSCVIDIHCTAGPGHYCKGLEIKSNNCEVVTIESKDSPSKYSNAIIHAPGSGGNLKIKEAAIMYSSILSILETASIIVEFHHSGRYNNIIDGQYILGDLNVSCEGSARCDGTKIICGSDNTGCNINCSGHSYGFGACTAMTVDVRRRTSDINWYCNNSIPITCVDANLQCGDINNANYTLWKYNAFNEWYYANGDCVTNWTAPVITCDIKTDDTCYIIRHYLDTSRTISCVNDLTDCLIQLGDIQSTKDWSRGLQSIIHCPSSIECNSCIIQCNSDFACWGVTIHGHNCSSLQVNFKTRRHHYVTIYAPGNGGDLHVLSYIEGRYTSLQDSSIYSSPGTKNIFINFDHQAGYNFIDATYVTGYLNYTCGKNGDCMYNEIICPNDASCNIDCIGKCWRMIIKAIEGVHDVNWQCNDQDESNCKYSNLLCNDNFSYSSTMEFMNDEWKLISGKWERNSNNTAWQFINSTNDCVNIDTAAPTPSPTWTTTNPTQLTAIPTIPPTSSPTGSPTSAPALPEFSLDTTETGVVIGCTLLVLIIVVIALIYYFKFYKMEKQSLYITNAMVIIIGIGEYDDAELNSESDEIGGFLNDLNGISQDINNMIQLFHHELNYDIFPMQYLDDLRNSYSPKQYWTEKELNMFLVDKAKYLAENIENKKYDA
eukprot:459844_1